MTSTEAAWAGSDRRKTLGPWIPGALAAGGGRPGVSTVTPATYLAASAFHFVGQLPAKALAALWSRLSSDSLPVEVNRPQRELALMETAAPFTEGRTGRNRLRRSQRNLDDSE